MDLHPELLVVGAGPAGLSAASEATRAGVRTLVLDAGESTGGQFYARPPGGAWDEGVPQALVTGARLELLDVRLRTAVWGAFGDSVAVVREGHSSLVRPGSIVLATGATERVVPFPGWDQPGVVAPGGLQRLLKVARVVPNGAVVLAGSGPFLLAVAADLRRAGADVRAVVEARSRYELAGLLRGLARNPERRREAIGFARALRGVELRFGVSVRGAEEGSVRLSDGTRIPADVLCVGYGFRPRLELARLLGLAATSAGVRVNPALETSRPGVFAAGEATGVGGAALAAAEGRLAGLAAASHLGKPGGTDMQHYRHLHEVRDRHARFARRIETVYRPVPVLSAADPGTTICRCEHVTLADIRRAGRLPVPAHDLRAVKAELRCGMGACQGTICTEAVAAAGGFGGDLEGGQAPHARPPAAPVSVAEVAGGSLLDGEMARD